MKVFFCIFSLLFFNFLDAQKIHSVYVQIKRETFKNHYKNYSEYDSIILYKDSTFKKTHSYFGFDEIDKKSYSGNWSKSNKELKLFVTKRKDSSKVSKIEPFELSFKINYLKKNYKRVQ